MPAAAPEEPHPHQQEKLLPGPAGVQGRGRIRPAGRYEIVAVASSAGGVSALGQLLQALPARLAAPVLVVQHLDPRHETVLAHVLGRHAKLTIQLATAGTRAEAGTVYLAPPDQHLLVRPGGVLTLSDSERVHFVRPSADLLFESLARAYGPRAIACVLTGTGSDGATGVAAVKARGGTVIVQDPESAEFKGMPEAAVRTGAADFVLPLDEVATVIERLVDGERDR